MRMATTISRVLLLVKRSAFDMYVARHNDPNITRLLCLQPEVVGNLKDRHRVHEDTLQICTNILSSRHPHIQYKTLIRDQLSDPIRDVDLVITIGGDGTLLQASHYVHNSTPVLGVNSDPTQMNEVEEKLEEFDASRSSGHLCVATAGNFEQMLDRILDGLLEPVQLRRISISIDGVKIAAPALNDILIAHPNPAAVSRCTFSIVRDDTGEHVSPIIQSRSSGLRICTATGSTAAMKSAGGIVMPSLSTDLQYMVREPLCPHLKQESFMKGFVRTGRALQVHWRCRQGTIYVDGSHLCHPINFGSKIELSAQCAPLHMFARSSKFVQP